MLMYNASLTSGAFFQTLPSPSFDFGTGDFSAGAMIITSAGGPVLSRLGPTGGGFLLSVSPDSTITFATTDGAGTWLVQSAGTDVLDGCCHSVLAVRQGAAMQILLDGAPLPVTGAGTGSSPLNVSNNLPLLIGSTRSAQPVTQFIGTVMNAGVWDTALSGGSVVAVAFARVRASDPGLQGYWTLDLTTNDLSPNGNPASMVGPVRFQPCVDCVFTTGANNYGFCQMSNTPTAGQRADPDLQADVLIGQARHLDVQPGTPALFASIMSDADVPAFPAGVTVSITDPSGQTYDSDVNSDTVFVVTGDGQPWGVSVINPQPGPWYLSVSAPATTGFRLQLQTCPAAAVVPTITDALLPLYGPGTMTSGAADDVGSWLRVLAIVAVSALAGAIIAGLTVFSGGTVLLAAAAGIAGFASVGLETAQLTIQALNTTSMEFASTQVGGMTGFLVAEDALLLVDANVDNDKATLLMYKRRSKVLYPYVTASTFNKKQQTLVGDQDTRANVSAALTSFSSGYASLAGHGAFYFLTGWRVEGEPTRLQVILETGKYDPAEAQSKIIHMFACHCGSTSAVGLGRNLVAKGAVAFFGYSQPYILSTEEPWIFCDCDIEIDKALIDGKTCDEAYIAAIAKYNAGIAELRSWGNYKVAAYLELDRDRLVAPSTDPAYGDKTASLKTGAHP
jgi:hypothetical protein